MQADLHLCCSHMAKTGFLMTWLISLDMKYINYIFKLIFLSCFPFHKVPSFAISNTE